VDLDKLPESGNVLVDNLVIQDALDQCKMSENAIQSFVNPGNSGHNGHHVTEHVAVELSHVQGSVLVANLDLKDARELVKKLNYVTPRSANHGLLGWNGPRVPYHVVLA